MKTMIAGAACALAFAGATQAAAVHDSSFTEPSGERVLQESIEIAAPPACAWAQLVDPAALRASGMAAVHVDLRNGGVIEEGFAANAEPAQMIRHQIIAYLPERLLVLRNISTPPGLPHAELYPNIVQLDAIEPLDGGRTRVTLSHTGYGQGAGYDALYAFFRQGNAGYLVAIKQACEGTTAGNRS